ncbi:acyltransferase family protein [Kaistia geumhonensis]|uniref:Peptidoglycan/LPS O-acetylase OafA/YrhL n=1 Tax=Kaistia geumhonensis TaxID=410839 RepID=A0ABU0M474_9HYPH|nr:acyltransferase family protein [Kaistia geumhonensis]MCX5479023.1 acyltransferase family protein [Kaistia geumhonensis]MDQ0515757.1 peptidoglycan/LPS O-acetylase OafA/YrhL [Kaistia geumhonensis]
MTARYRPEIDGLRTVAVLSVIIYHLEIPLGSSFLLHGGFLGVDIFFVLSGYLIGGIILRELQDTGRFSFSNFYARRIRRIFPELIFVILVSIPVAWAILLPSELVRFATSIISALGFFSNFYWYQELGEYGAQSGLLQPFLHTWSLSIEEQFYVVFPVLLIVLYKIKSGKWIGPALIALILISLVLCQFTTFIKPPLSFFSPVSRAWELLAGAGLAFLELKRPGLLLNSRIAGFIPSIMAVVMLLSLAFVSLDDGHPGIVTIPIIVATCGVIWFARKDEITTRLLSTSGMTYVGKISYALYLWHFPIFAFGRLRSLEAPTALDMLGWVALTFVMSWIGYTVVERPFRFKIQTRPFASSIAASLVAIACFTVVVVRDDGFPGRFAYMAARLGENKIDAEALAEESMKILDELAPNESIGRWNAGVRSKHEIEDNWFSGQAAENVLVIGNSHSKDMFNAVYQNRDRLQGVEFARLAFDADMSAKSFDQMFDLPNYKNATTIMVAPKYRSTSILSLDRYLARMLKDGKKVILVGNTAEFSSPGTMPIFDWYIWKQTGDVDFKQLNQLAYKYESEEAKIYTARVAALAEKYGVPFYDRRALVCDDLAKECAMVTPEGKRTMYDASHWTLDGAGYFGSRAADMGWLKPDEAVPVSQQGL